MKNLATRSFSAFKARFSSFTKSLLITLIIIKIGFLTSSCEKGTLVPFTTDPPTENALIFNEVDDERSTLYNTENGYIKEGSIRRSNQVLITFASRLREMNSRTGNFDNGDAALFQLTIGDTDDDISGRYFLRTNDDEIEFNDGEVSPNVTLELPLFDKDYDGVFLKTGSIEITDQGDGVYLFNYDFDADWSRYDPENHSARRKNIRLIGKYEGELISRDL